MEIHFGVETEFGIQSEADDRADVVAESIALVRSALNLGVSMRWDYGFEDPHADARGFRVSALRQDVDEADYEDQDRGRPLSFSEIKSDLVLPNGARFYNDHAHPEYCTPECSTPFELVAQDRGGELLVTACAARLKEDRGHGVRIYKNNTDFAGHSYGCHENYLIPRQLPWKSLSQGVQAFLVTRQVFLGAGKFGFEEEDRFLRGGFQISQRADFFTELESVDTMQRRPLVNTRDEPHANEARYRRFHVIIGDANMNPWATAMKTGCTALVLESLLCEACGALPRLVRPLEDLRRISADASLRSTSEVHGGRWLTAIAIQRHYWEHVSQTCDLEPAWKRWVLNEWREVLDDLEVDPERCRDRVDWVAKRALLQQFQDQEGLDVSDPWLRSLDLEYHRVDPEHGLFHGLERSGWFRRFDGVDPCQETLWTPPETTRAWVRGTLIGRFGTAIESAQWDHVTLKTSRGSLRVSLRDAFEQSELKRLRAAVDAAKVPEDLWSLYE